MSRVQIEILDATNGIEGVIDLQNSDNFPLSLTKKAGNIADITSRSGTFSSSFKIPSTKVNNKLLGSMYHSQTKNTKEYFVKKDAIILVNGNTFQRGKLRIERISTNGKYKEYKAVFFGDNSEWITLLKETYLSDINLDSSVTLNSSAILNSWTNTSASDEYVMNYINRGLNKTYLKRASVRGWTASNLSDHLEKNIAHIEDFNPDIFVKQILKKSFLSIGYNFNSTFFDSDGSALIHSEISDDYKKTGTANNYAEIQSSTTQNYTVGILGAIETHIDGESGGFITGAKFGEIDFNSKISDVNINYDTTANIYTVPREGMYDIDIDLDVTIFSTFLASNSQIISSPVSEDIIQPHLAILKENVIGQYDLEVVGQWRLWNDGVTPTHSVNSKEGMLLDTSLGKQTRKYKLTDVYLLENDRIKFGVVFQSLNGVNYKVALSIHSGTSLKITEKRAIVRNNTFNLKDVVDSSKNSILSLISDYTAAFNLYWRTDNISKTVYCEPRDTFYDSLSNAKDWTSKIDVSSYNLTPLASSFQRNLMFRYATDSIDKYLIERDKQNIINWGSYSHDLGSNFKNGTKTIGLNVYAASYFIDNDNNVYNGTDVGLAPNTSRLWQDVLGGIPEFSEKFKPRLLNYNYSNGYTFYYETEDSTKDFSNSNQTDAPVGIFVNGKNNLHFATVNSKNGLFIEHYSKTFDLISNGFGLTIKANLSNTDLNKFKISDVIYFSAPFDLKGYWAIQEIAKIEPLQQGLVNLNLIQHKVFEPITEGTTVIPDVGTGSDPLPPSSVTDIKFRP